MIDLPIKPLVFRMVFSCVVAMLVFECWHNITFDSDPHLRHRWKLQQRLCYLRTDLNGTLRVISEGKHLLREIRICDPLVDRQSPQGNARSPSRCSASVAKYFLRRGYCGRETSHVARSWSPQ